MICIYCEKIIGDTQKEVCRLCRVKRIVRDKDRVYQDARKELDEAKNTLIELLIEEKK